MNQISSSMSLFSSAEITSKKNGAPKKIIILDTSISSVNLGDQVIAEASNKVLHKIFPHAFYVSMPTHEFMLWESYRVLRDCDHVFVAGSNLLKSKMLWRNQWKISPLDLIFRRNSTLLGCGWWNYQVTPDFYSRFALNKILSKKGLHSVRDDYSRRQLEAAGISNVRNTSCVTMWDLTPEHCIGIPKEKAPSVVTALTGYHPDEAADRALLNLLKKHYKEVIFWVQQPEDMAYGLSLSDGSMKFMSPNLATYSDFLKNNHVDYIGSRLHGGIRALQLRKRSLILAVDNRALEINKDTNLPVYKRENLAAIESWITGAAETKIVLPQKNIDEWKSQYSV
jgi:hypothetical protein